MHILETHIHLSFDLLYVMCLQICLSINHCSRGLATPENRQKQLEMFFWSRLAGLWKQNYLEVLSWLLADH